MKVETAVIDLKDLEEIKKSLTLSREIQSSQNQLLLLVRRLKIYFIIKTCSDIPICKKWEMRCKSMDRKKKQDSWRKKLTS